MLGVASILLMALVGLALARDLAGNAAIVTRPGRRRPRLCAVTLLLIFSPRSGGAGLASCRRPRPAVQHLGARLARVDPQVRGAHSAARWPCSPARSPCRCCACVQAYCLGRGLGIDAPLAAYFAFVPLILLVMLLPVTFNGIGTSQAAFVWFFSRAGVSSAAAFALSVLFVALGIVGNLPGAVLYAAGSREPDARPTTP